MQTLSGYLDRLFEITYGLTAPQRLDAGRAAIDLLAMALRDVVPSVVRGPGGRGARRLATATLFATVPGAATAVAAELLVALLAGLRSRNGGRR